MRISLYISSIICLLSFSYFVEPPIIDELISEDVPYLVDLYKHIHQHPEISLKEEKTAMRLGQELSDVGFEVTEQIGGTGVVAVMKNGDGPTILYRTDMDALPMYEKTGLPYQSESEIEYNGLTTGAMHSCGHDIHMATWVGVGRAMSKIKDQWSGKLVLIGQPAEEIGAGAKAMLDDGLYEKFGVPDYGIGLHSSPIIKKGQIGITDGFTMATTESIDIKVKGVGAHGASPHMSIDPVVIASMIVMELQTIVSRSMKPTDSAVVTVGAIKGGTKHNIIPDEVSLQLTVRTYTKEVRDMVHKRIREIAIGTAYAAGLPQDKMPEVIISENATPANYNDPVLTKSISDSAAKAIGSTNVIYQEPLMVGEDFSRYGSTDHKVPTVLFWLGTVPQEKIDKGNLPGLHSPYYFPEPSGSIETGVKVVCQSMLDLLD